ncbi:MAG: LTA synthase family protein [Candidatus Staskawiczbacteria bacterium]|nr:LTA synthase family protein [Candidatus Staskawiczbacteria bacterium]
MMDKINGIRQKLINKIVAWVSFTALPLILAVLFVIQNQVFNEWLNIYYKAYSARLFWATFALGIFFYAPYLLLKKRYRYLYLFLISFLLSFIFTAQFLYYRYWQSFLQFSAIKYFGLAHSVMGTVKVLITPELFFFYINIAVVLVAFLLFRRRKDVEIVLPKWEKIIIILAMMAMVFLGYKYLLYTEKKEWGDTSRLYKDVYDLKSLVGKIGIVNFFIEDTFKYILRSDLVTDDDKIFLQKFAQNKIIPDTGKNYFGVAKGKNLIIVQVESLENIVINKRIGEQEITPNLNQLAKDGLYFKNFYAQVGPGNTADTEFSTMNSLYPLPDDVVFINYAKNQYEALPQLLVNNGYKTYSLHGDVPTFWNRSNIYPQLGYQKTYNLSDYVALRSIGKGPSDLGDEDLFSQSLPRLESFSAQGGSASGGKQPFMATLITMSSHTPFILPDDLQTLKIPTSLNLGWIQAAYLQSMHYTDKAIGEFIDGLKKDGLYDNSLILIWGDHGSFTNISQALNQENTFSALNNSQVPMILSAPGTNLKGATNIPASQLDVYPTIVNLLGIVPPNTILGHDLLNTETPVETHFELVSGGIDVILTKNLAYQADETGVFTHGLCVSLPDQKSLPISDCQQIYTEQSNTIKASNIIVRGNLLNFYSANLKK